MALRPFRALAGFDSHGERGINLAAPVDPTDFAQKQWTEEMIAAQSRLRGTYRPDSDGLETPLPDLTALIPDVDVLSADYWITDISGRSATGPYARVELNADDRLVAKVSNGGATAITLNPGTIAGLIPNEVYRFEPTDPAYTGNGQKLGILLFVNATGDLFANAISNSGYDYVAGETINGVIPNTFVNAIAPTPAVTPGVFQLLPDTTYYDLVITGGTGSNFRANVRTGATGTELAQVFILDRGVGYTVGDTLTLDIEGQIIGTMDVTAVYTGADIPCQVTIDTVGLTTGWDLIRGPGLTRAQADQDYLRLDGANVPRRDIGWNDFSIKDLADPLEPQDAVNLRTLEANSAGSFFWADVPAHSFAVGETVYFDANGDWQAADATALDSFAGFLIDRIEVDRIRVVYHGLATVTGHGFPVGSILYQQDTPGQIDVTPGTLQQEVAIAQTDDRLYVVITQADDDYLRLDGENTPRENVRWADNQLKELADPTEDQDAVNLRTLMANSSAGYFWVDQVAHPFQVRQALYFDGGWQLASATDLSTFAGFVVVEVEADRFRVAFDGKVDVGAHGFPVGAPLYLQDAAGGIGINPGTLQQEVAVVHSATEWFLTEAGQSNDDYLRLDGANSPRENIPFGDNQLKELADPTDDQDAVNLQTMVANSRNGYFWVDAPVHPFLVGEVVFFDGTWQLASAASTATLAEFIVLERELDRFRASFHGVVEVGAHGFPVGATLFLQDNPGRLDTTPGSNTQEVAVVHSATEYYFNPAGASAGGGTGTGIEDWTSTTNYGIGAYVRYIPSNAIYRCIERHLSGADFVADKDAGRWEALSGYVSTLAENEGGPQSQKIKAQTLYVTDVEPPVVPPLAAPNPPTTTIPPRLLSRSIANTQGGNGPRPTPVNCTGAGQAGVGITTSNQDFPGGWIANGFANGDIIQSRTTTTNLFLFQGPIRNVGWGGDNHAIDFFGDEVTDQSGNPVCFNFNNIGVNSLWTVTSAPLIESTQITSVVRNQADGTYLITFAEAVNGSAPSMPTAWVVGDAIIPLSDLTGETYVVMEELTAPNQIRINPNQSLPYDYVPLPGTAMCTSRQAAPVRPAFDERRTPLLDNEIVPKWYADQSGFDSVSSTTSWAGGTWLRVGVLEGYQLVELDMRSLIQGVGSGAIRIVVGAGFGGSGKCQIQGQSQNSYIDGVRLVNLGSGRSAVDVRTEQGNTQLRSVVVVGKSDPNGFAVADTIEEAPADPPHTQFDFNRGTQYAFLNGNSDQDYTIGSNGAVTINGELTLNGATTVNNTTTVSGTNQINFGTGLRQMLNLNNANYGIGIQSQTTYFRSNSTFRWFRGGTHNDAAGNAGGGTEAMTLDGNSDLTVGRDFIAGRRALNASARNSPDARELIERGYLDGRLPTPFPVEEQSFSSGSSGANNYVEAGSFNSGSMNNAIGWITANYSSGGSNHVQKFFFSGYAGSNSYGWYMTVGFNVRRTGIFDRVNLKASAASLNTLSRVTLRKKNSENKTCRVAVQRAERWNWNLSAAGTQHGTSAPGTGPQAEATIASPFMRESSSGVWGFHSENWFDGIDEAGQIIRGGYYLDPVDSMGVVDFAALQAEDPDVQPGFPVLRRRVNKANAQRLLWSLQAWLKEWSFEAMLTGDVFTPTAEMVAGIRFLQGIIMNPPSDRFVSPADYADNNVNMALHMFNLSQPTLKLDWDLEVDWDEHDDKLSWEQRRALEG